MDSSDSEPSDSKNVFKCAIPGCSALFSKNRKLINHVRKHTGERPFVCDEPGCTKTYTNSSHLRRHKSLSHGEKVSQTVSCDFEGCGAVLANKYSLKKHFNRKHNPDRYSFKCFTCKQGFHRKKELQQHVYLHTGKATFNCDKCDMTFTTNYFLNKHKRSHRTYNCDCGDEFHRWSLMLAHRKSCEKSRIRCDKCDKTFTTPGNLKSHRLTHMNKSEKLIFRCQYPECTRFYFYKRNLQIHINTFHIRTNDNQTFKCTYPRCQVVLRTKRSQKLHIERHFNWKEKRERKIRCDKGIPKKSIVEVLVGKELIVTHNQKNNNTEKIITSQVCVPEECNDPLLEQCDLTIQMLNERMLTAN